MSGVGVNCNREKQICILAKVGFVSNKNGCAKLHYGLRCSIKDNFNPENSKIWPTCVVKDPKQTRACRVFFKLLQVGIPVMSLSSKNHFQILKEKRKLSPTLLSAKANLNLILVHFSIEKKKYIFCAPLRD
jgi:hypothetical protein